MLPSSSRIPIGRLPTRERLQWDLASSWGGGLVDPRPTRYVRRVRYVRYVRYVCYVRHVRYVDPRHTRHEDSKAPP